MNLRFMKYESDGHLFPAGGLPVLLEEFSTKDCIHANVTVMGQTMEARFRMNCSVEPCQLDIEVLPKGTSCYWVQT